LRFFSFLVSAGARILLGWGANLLDFRQRRLVTRLLLGSSYPVQFFPR